MNPIDGLRLGSASKLPVILQIEASECGLASLAMVAHFHGHATDLAELRRRHAISLKGATLKDIIHIADQLGMAGRPLRLDLDELAELKTPCVLHWDLNHFVVLASVTRDYIVIHDPAIGIRKLPMAEVSAHFSGVALELTPTARFERKPPAPGLKLSQVVGRIQGLKRSFGHLIALALAIEVFAMLSPMFLGWVVDQVLVTADRDLLMTLAFGFLLLLVLQTSLSALRSWMLMGLNASLKVQSRANLFTHLLNLPTSYFETRHLGDVMSRFSSQDTILQAMTSELVESLLDGLMATVTLVIMFILAPDMALLVLLGACIYAAMRWASFAQLRETSAEAIVWAARRDSHFLETVRGIRTIKLFNGQADRRVTWLNLLVETINRQLTVERFRILLRTANQLLLGALVILIVWLGARRVLDGGFSVGLLFAFISYKDQFLSRVSELINKVVDLTMLRLHSERLADIALTEPEARVTQPISVMPAADAVSIELRNVSFRYSEHEAWVLRNLSLRVSAGESVAITGASGGGKTTLLKLVAGLLPPTEGQILINGAPISRIGIDQYRAMMGVVMQDDQLFAGSIADNITFFADNPDLTFAEHCAKLAAVHDDVAAMPMGYGSLIGDMGTILSGGQKQRVLIARALYRRPKVLLLDEATSHLDVTRERAVNLALRSWQVTRIMVAHRPETIRAADREISLDAAFSRNSFLATRQF